MKPILFNTEMVQAILDGQKTVTRRTVKPRPGFLINGDVPDPLNPNRRLKAALFSAGGYVLPSYQPGDILYVRETWGKIQHKDGLKRYVYKATDEYPFGEEGYIVKFRWHPSIHMPKEAARIFLRVTDVRVERVQDITVEGCRAEGIYDDYKTFSKEYHDLLITKAYPLTFAKLWDSTIKPADRDRYGWDANPWVWVIDFERVQKEEQNYENWHEG